MGINSIRKVLLQTEMGKRHVSNHTKTQLMSSPAKFAQKNYAAFELVAILRRLCEALVSKPLVELA